MPLLPQPSRLCPAPRRLGSTLCKPRQAAGPAKVPTAGHAVGILITAGLLAALLEGCTATTPPVPSAVSKPAPQPAESGATKAGETLLQDHERIANDIACVNARRFPAPTIEEQQIEPAVIAPGQQFTQTLIYSVCAQDLEQFVSGMLYRKIYFRGHLVHSEPKPIDLKPGRWKLTAVIEVPEQSKPGTYELRTEFLGGGERTRKPVRLKQSSKFEVQ